MAGDCKQPSRLSAGAHASFDCPGCARLGKSRAVVLFAHSAGVVQAPTTAFVIVAEMINGYALVVQLMLAALIDCAASRWSVGKGASRARCRLRRSRSAPLTEPLVCPASPNLSSFVL